MGLTKIGRYHIRGQVGKGATATVFRAFDPHFQRIVALKLLPANLLNDVGVRARFEREAHTVAALEHPAIVPVYDFGEEEDRLYFVMRFMDGGSLADRLHKKPLSLPAAAAIFNRLAPALDEAHEQGVIHRDLKPGNILFDRRNLPYLADFGIVKLSQEDITTLTTVGGIVGTPAYMSPEQVRGKEKLDGRSDIYALGVILFQMLTARLPFNAETPLGIAVQHVTAPVPRILDFKNNLPDGCQAIISRAMAKERAERFQTATEMATALAQLAEESVAGDEAGGADIGGEEEVAGLYTEAVAAMEAERWEEAIEKLNAILAISPVYRDTVTRLAEANRRRRTAELLAQARNAVDAEAWDEAQALAAQILSMEPDHDAAAALQEEAATGKRLDRLYRQAADAHESEAWDEAIELLEQVVAGDDGYRDARQRLAEARRGRRAHALFEEAQAHAAAEEWEKVVAKAQAALALRPDDAGYQALLEEAHVAAGEETSPEPAQEALAEAPREEATEGTMPRREAGLPLWRQPHVILVIVLVVLLGSLGLGYAALGTPPTGTTATPFATWAYTPGSGTAAPAAGDGPAPTPTASNTPSPSATPTATSTATATATPTPTASNTPRPSATATLLFPTATSSPPAPSPTTAGEEIQPPPPQPPGPQPTDTPAPPTDTPPPPTPTPPPPTNTPPPTDTPRPTDTRPPPTPTEGPPTRGPTPTPP